MMKKETTETTENIIVIKDFKKILYTLFVLGVFAFLLKGTLANYKVAFKYGREYPSILETAFITLGAIVSYLRLKVVFGGIQVNPENDEFSFPGGGIKFNEIGEVASNLNQYLKRYTYKISEIQYAETSVKTRVDNKGNIRYNYLLTLTGVRGAITIPFTNAPQRDQVYSIIVNFNNMGVPVSNR